MCSDINYASIFEDLARFTGLPLVRRGRRWEGMCYADGTFHPKRRRDKTVAMMKHGTIMITEQGGWNGDLWKWLRDYKLMSDLEIGNSLRDETANLPAIEYELPPTKYVHPNALNETLGHYRDALFGYLSSLFGKERVMDAYNRYFVGTNYYCKGTWGTCFWFIKEDGLICRDKGVFYKENGHRDHDKKPDSDYPVYKGYDRKCFFGEHLLKGYTGDVYVVESEKTALLMYLKYGVLCIATGGSNCIKGFRKGWKLLPDFDEAGFGWFDLEGANVIKWWESFGYKPAKGEDIGDFIVKSFGESR